MLEAQHKADAWGNGNSGPEGGAAPVHGVQAPAPEENRGQGRGDNPIMFLRDPPFQGREYDQICSGALNIAV